MKKRVIAMAAVMIAVTICGTASAEIDYAAGGAHPYICAFPGAEGSGMYTSGAREAFFEGNKNAAEVYHVTNLNDDGEGSFRDAVSRGDRIIVFDVSGMIDLKSRVSITHDNITVMGHTAPGDGICFRGNSVKINGSNIIMRYLRFRPGAKLADGSDTITQDGFSIPIGVKNVILDHCSISWGTDENLSIIGGEDITVQRCIISEALNSSIHDKGEHSYAGIWGGINISMHHNIIASHKSRNPKIGTSETVSMTPGHTDDETVVDMWNNIFYNWGDKAGYGAENGANVNIVNNYYKPGPATPSNKRARIFELSPGNKYQKNWSGDIYASGNYIDDGGADAQAVNADNWQIEKGTGVYLASSDITYNKLNELNRFSYLYDMENEKPSEISSAKEAYEDVLSDVGATLPRQDLIDARITDNVKNRTAPERGLHGSEYLVDDPIDAVPEGQEDLYDDRGYPIWVSETRAADFDKDNDGIADEWEDKMGLDKTNPNDSLNLGPDNYTWLEIYGESLIGDNTVNTAVKVENKIGNEYTLSVDSASAVKATFYCDNMEITDDSHTDENNELSGVTDGDLVIKASYDGTVLKEVKSAVYGEDFVMPEISGDNTRVFVWDSFDGMKPVSVSSNSVNTLLDTGMYQISAKLTYADGSYKITPVTVVTTAEDEAQTASVSGDFEIVGTIDELPNLVNNVYKGIYADDFVIAAGYNDDFKPVIRYGKKSNDTLSEKDNKGYKYIKISVKNGHADLYAASTIGLWDKLSESGYDYKGIDPTAGGYQINPENKEYAAHLSWRMVTDFTAPTLTVNDIADNSVIGFNERISVTIKAADNTAVKGAVVLFNDEIIAEKSGFRLYNKEETISIFVPFDGAKEGTLTVLCYDSNYQSASQSLRVFVSADAAPWLVTDISADGNKNKAYMYATEDYTFKIGGMDGNIGGVADECGFVYQKFTDDNRIYYRSRMQDGKQFGIMLRKSLDSDSESYFFGGENNGGITYSVKKRDFQGDETETETIDGLTAKDLYFIAEKSGNTLNIYQINEKNTISDNITLLKSIDVRTLGNEYYMGFASVSDGTGNPPDCGWIGIDNSAGSDYIWNFDNGLDWQWQIQERNVLKPVWTKEKLNGTNKECVMLLAPDDNYSGERYVFHEYFMDDEYVPLMGTGVMLTGEEPAMNIYLQSGDSNTAYKLTFDSDNKIKDADKNEFGVWEKDTLYNVNMRVRIDEESMDTVCEVSVRNKRDNTSVVYDTVIPTDGSFRTQNNIQKKTPVTKAVYFEPIASANGKYYIEGVSVIPKQGAYKIVTDRKMYTFDNEEAYSAMTIGGVSTEALSKAKKVAGTDFMSKVRLSKSSHTLTFPVTGDCEIRIYAVSANKSEVRSLVLNDGAETELAFNSNGWNDIDSSAAVYYYKGEARNIVVSAKAGVDVYGVEVITKRLAPTE